MWSDVFSRLGGAFTLDHLKSSGIAVLAALAVLVGLAYLGFIAGGLPFDLPSLLSGPGLLVVAALVFAVMIGDVVTSAVIGAV